MFEARNDNLVVKLPYGFRDIFPVESRERKIIQGLIGKEFRQWGYGEVNTPVVEFTKNISAGVGEKWSNKLINFLDIDGSLVSLRTDMTIPIARLAGMRIKKSQLPARFCYFANSFRQSALQAGVKRVYSQAGLEFIGSDSFMADVEVLSILNTVLKKLGFKDYKIGLGHLKLIEGLCKWLKLDDKQAKFIKENLVLKNFVNIEKLLIRFGKNKADKFFHLIKPHRSIYDVEEAISGMNIENINEGIEYIKKVYGILDKLGFGDNILIDFSILREFDYYTGLLFEVYSPQTTDMVGSGGRYDGLIKKFGLDVPATGFALDLDLLHKSMDNSILEPYKKDIKILLCSAAVNRVKFLEISKRFRDRDVEVELLFDKRENVDSIAREKNCKFVCELDKGLESIAVKNLESGKREIKEIDHFINEIGRKNEP